MPPEHECVSIYCYNIVQLFKSPWTVTVWWCHASVNYYFRFHNENRLRFSKSRREGDVGTLDSEALQACFHVFLITMQLFFSIWEFRSQQISSSTENIYLVKTSVIFAIRGHREGLKTNFSALHLGGHGSSELLLFKSQWFRCHERFQRDCIWSLCRLVVNLRIDGHELCCCDCSPGRWDCSLAP